MLECERDNGARPMAVLAPQWTGQKTPILEATTTLGNASRTVRDSDGRSCDDRSETGDAHHKNVPPELRQSCSWELQEQRIKQSARPCETKSWQWQSTIVKEHCSPRGGLDDMEIGQVTSRTGWKGKGRDRESKGKRQIKQTSRRC